MIKNYQIEVSPSNGEEKNKVLIYQKLNHADGDSMCREMKQYLEQGFKDWDVCLNKLTFCDSITLGIFVMLHTAGQRFSGKIRFTVIPDSQVCKLLFTSKLNSILSIAEVSEA